MSSIAGRQRIDRHAERSRASHGDFVAPRGASETPYTPGIPAGGAAPRGGSYGPTAPTEDLLLGSNPTGSAGGALAGQYPNPKLAVYPASFAVAYNGDGSVASVTRSGVQPGSVTLTYVASKVTQVLSVHDGYTVTTTPSYDGLGRITGITRAVV